MASAPVPFKPAARQSEQNPDDPILKHMNLLVQRARDDRGRHQGRIADCYRYALPWRHKFGQSQTTPGELDEVFDETPGIVLEDFAADMLNTFTPQKNNWLSEEPTQKAFVNQGEEAAFKKQLEGMLKLRQTVVFSEMARSSLYQALQESYLDLGPGTMALLIPPDQNMAEPIRCEAIPATDLLITRGPDGLVDGKFRCRKYLRSDAKYLWPNAKWEMLGPEPADPNIQEIEIIDGCWRDWSNRGTETYEYAVQASGKVIYHKTYQGAGSCPFIVARWARDPTTAWGFGPTYRVLAAIKTLNHVRYLDLKNYDKYVDPPTSYEDDGVINVDHGVGPGDWIPRAMGSEAPEPIESKSRFDVAIFERDELRHIIKAAHYQDRPEQQGKTPPTAFQWADERAERARRMGTPATNLVIELQIPIYKRFVYLLSERNVLPKVALSGRDVAVQPISPLLRAQEQEEVLRMDRFAEMITVRFGPDIGNIIINQFKHARDLAKLMGYNEDRLRNEADIEQAIRMLLPVLQGQGGGAGGAVAPPPVGVLGP